MKKPLKIFLVIFLSLFTLFFSLFLVYILITSNSKLDSNKLVNVNRGVVYLDKNNDVIDEESNGIKITKIEDINQNTINAFIAIEDKRFYKHKGVDIKGLNRALFNNIKSFSFKEGASTISQQLIKNTHLTSEKTLKRKLVEIKLSKQLEKKYSKNEILEMYLNTIYFGENCYGITSASKKYFNKKPNELSINESAMLAGIIKAPSNYSPTNNYDKCNERKDVVIKCMYEQNYINIDEFSENYNKKIEKNQNQTIKNDYLYLLKKESEKFSDDAALYGKKYYIYSNFDKEKQQILDDNIILENDKEKSAIIISNDNKILAYKSSCGDVRRNLGSTIKPLLVYAPCLEENFITLQTPILDEKININGYSPSNFNQVYYGYISAKDSLCKSLNSCAVKLLNNFGIEKAKNYVSKTDIELTNNDNSLCIALGSTEKGASLKEITSAYNTFANDGYYSTPTCINKIDDELGNTVYQSQNVKTKIFSEDTSYLINSALNDCTKTGTAKKLSKLPFNICAKTGTVGNENGNTDAYSISYNKDYSISVWYGNKENSLLNNSITGGTKPTENLLSIWKNIYKNTSAPDFFESNLVEEIDLDKISYEENHEELLADKNAPSRYKIKGLYKNNFKPKNQSNRFSLPVIEKPILSVNNRRILIQLCLKELTNCQIFRHFNGEKKLVYDSINEKNYSFSETLENDGEYQYSIVPYYKNDKEILYGNEIFLDKIFITNENEINLDNWWED